MLQYTRGHNGMTVARESVIVLNLDVGPSKTKANMVQDGVSAKPVQSNRLFIT